MPRSTPEWIGRTDDSRPTRACYRRKFKEAGGRCQGPCHKQLGPADKWDLDHIVPLADGGENRESNLQVLCKGKGSCHEKKTALENSARAVTNAIYDRHNGIKRPSLWRQRYAALKQRGYDPWKRTLAGERKP